jgi:quercetin 2,3-dioxygenase
MVNVRPGDARGHVGLGWLDSRHSFSFGHYYDPAHMGFRALRVINEDRVEPGTGFDPHPHRDMEILTYVLEGALQHEDSMGNGSTIRPGEVQRMSAGTGVVHSEHNASEREPVHLLQIWIEPREPGLAPGYEQKAFPAAERQGRLRLLASPDGREGSLTVHQDAALYAALLAEGDAVRHELGPDRHAWVQVARGAVTVNGQWVRAGDGVALSGETAVELRGEQPSEVLLFDLA